MAGPADRLAGTLANVERRLSALERTGQLARASVRINGDTVRLVDGIASGLQASVDAADALQKAASAEAKADGAVAVFYESTEPMSPSLGDFWVDDSGNVWTYNGSSWQAVTSTAVADALTTAQNAEAAADGKITTYFGATEPVAEAVGDLWFDEANGNLLKRWDGTTWVLVRDADIDQALQDAAAASAVAQDAQNTADQAAATASTALTTADGKNSVTWSTSEPYTDGTKAGDLWFRRHSDPQIDTIIGQWEWTGSTWQPHPIDSDTIASLTAGKITTGSIAAGQEIIAGNPSGTHARMTDNGFYVSGYDDTGLRRDYVRMGTASADYFAIPDPNGDEGTIAAISEDGQAGFSSVNSANDIVVLGRELVGSMTDYPEPEGSGQYLPGWLDRFPRGIQGLTRQISDLGNVGTSEVGLLDVSALLTPYRQYRVVAQGYINCPDSAYVQMYLRWAEGATPTISSTLLNSYVLRDTKLGIQDVYFETFFATGGAITDARFLVSMAFASGSGHLYGRSTAPFIFYVEDIGPRIDATGGPNTGGGSTSTKTTYTSVWEATGTRTYRGDGSYRTDTTDAVQGYTSYNGDQHAQILFTGEAISGQSGVTVASAMSGATLVKAEVYLYANHWYYNSGGTALISPHSYTSYTSTVPNTTKVSSANWPKPGGRWVDITSVWSTSHRGIWVGKAGGTNLTYYGRFNGAGASSNRPLLRLTYKK